MRLSEGSTVVGVCRAEKEDEMPDENIEAVEAAEEAIAENAPETAAEGALDAEQPVTGEAPADPE
jgi:16S rRNA G1207 methylase RsmC